MKKGVKSLSIITIIAMMFTMIGNINPAAAAEKPVDPQNGRYVLQIVWDGFSTNLFKSIKDKNIKTPNIDALINDGLYMKDIQTTVPSYCASLAAAITGASPETNDCMYRYYDKDKNYITNDEMNMAAKTIFERINIQKADMKTLVLGYNVAGHSIDGRGVGTSDPVHSLKEYCPKGKDQLISFPTEAEDIKTALSGESNTIPKYILAYSNDMKYASGIEHLSTMVPSMDQKLGEIIQVLKDKGIYDKTTIILNSASSTYTAKNSIGSMLPNLSKEITTKTGVNTAYLTADTTPPEGTKAIFIKTYMMRYGQLSFTKAATQKDIDDVIKYLKDNYLLTDPQNATGKYIKQIMSPSDVNASPKYADYLLNPVENYTFSFNSKVYRPDDLDQMNQLFIISGYGINKGAAAPSGSVMDIPANICYLLNISNPENNEGNLWNIYNFANNNTPISIAVDNYNDGQVVSCNSINLKGHVDRTCNVTINGEKAGLDQNNAFSKDVQLIEGNNTIKLEAESNGEKFQRYINIMKEVTLAITSPSDKQVVKQDKIMVEGTVDRACNISINNEPLGLIQDQFKKEVQLTKGLNTITVVATLDNHTVTRSVSVNYITSDDIFTVYLNWDGFGKYFYDIASARGMVPVLDSLARDGVIFNNCYSGIPSITPVMQRSIVSGAWPVTTGYCYRYYDKTKNKVVESGDVNKAETMAEAVKRNGLKTASIHQFTLLNKGTSKGDPDHPYIEVSGDGTVRLDAAIKLVKGLPSGGVQMNELPKFLAIYVDDPDAIAHNDRDIVAYLNKPAATTEQERIDNVIVQLHYLDAKLGEFMQACKDKGIYDNMAFVLTTDHGMAPFGKQNANDDTGSLTMIYDFQSVLTGLGYKVEHLYTGSQPKADTDIVCVGTGGQEQLSFTKPYTEQDINKIVEALSKKDYVGKIMTKSELLSRGCDDGFADLIVSPKPPYHFKTNDESHTARGFHDSLDDKAQNVFSLMWGKGIKKGYEYNDRVYIIDFIPTLSNLMNIDGPKNATGSVLYNALDTITVTSTPSEITINRGDSVKLIPNSSLKDSSKISWNSSDATIADVDNSGKITAKKEGNAVINLLEGQNIVGTCTVKVVPKPSKNYPDSDDKVNNSNGKDKKTDTNKVVVTKERLAGENRYKTATSIAESFAPGKVKKIVLTTGNNFPDALSGSVLAKSLDAPILLTGSNSQENGSALDYIKNHLEKDGEIVILGGQGALPDDVVKEIKELGINNIKRLSGSDRYETCKLVNQQLNIKKGTPVFIVTGNDFADGLSIGSIAAIKGYPIILTDNNSLPSQTEEMLKNISPDQIFIVGGTGAVSDTVEKQIKSITSIADGNMIRLCGQGRYQTSIAVAKYFKLDGDTMCFASGEDFPDAISGSVLAAKHNAPIILVGNDLSTQKEYLDSVNYKNGIIFGGEGTIDSNIEKILQKAN